MASPSAGERPADPPVLPPDIWDHICSYMSKPSLFQLRLASRSLANVARRWAYRSLTLEGFGTSPARFAEIARSPSLRGLVRELTIDTWIGPDYPYHCNESYEVPAAFMDNLPYLRCFAGLRALHLRFSEHCGDEEERSGLTIEETWNLRYRVLDTVCHCMAGMWTRERQSEIDESMAEDLHEWVPGFDPEDDARLPPGEVIPLRELTIANLADYHEPRLSEAWEKVLALPSLVDLKLFLTTEGCDASPEAATYYPEKYEFFDEVPRSWLSPAVADKLEILSLFYRDYWGWFPKMDFRMVTLPRLKVLALGNYVFSHEWQREWIAALGRENGSGGLEELYLDDCPILYKAKQQGPLSTTDPGYPVTGTVLNSAWEPVKQRYPMRWHHILRRWAESMPGLRVFRMGHGEWDGTPEDTIRAIELDGGYDDINRDVWSHRTDYRLHRSFACPAPASDTDDYADYEAVWMTGRHLRGTGMIGNRMCQMQYIKYDIGLGPSPWITPEVHYTWPNQAPFAPEEGTADEDSAAYEVLMAAVEARAEPRLGEAVDAGPQLSE